MSMIIDFGRRVSSHLRVATAGYDHEIDMKNTDKNEADALGIVPKQELKAIIRKADNTKLKFKRHINTDGKISGWEQAGVNFNGVNLRPSTVIMRNSLSKHPVMLEPSINFDAENRSPPGAAPPRMHEEQGLRLGFYR